MSCLYFYKLNSGWPCDVTKNCNLSVTEIDNNFYQLKSDDISGATYNKDSMTISIFRNDGDIINIDISEIEEQYKQAIIEATSGITPSVVDINLEAELIEDGTLVLSWTDDTGGHMLEVSGFLTEASIRHDETLIGDGGSSNPLGINDTEKTGYYKSVLGITDELPVQDENHNIAIGSRWVVKKKQSKFGRLYSKEGMLAIINELKKQESAWRVPSKEDWDKLLNFSDVCDANHDGDSVGEYVGEVAGKMLKTIDYWISGESLDKYGFSVCPAGYVKDSILVGSGEEARFWTDTKQNGGQLYIKGFSYDHDNVLQTLNANNEWYSVRLVRDIDKNFPDEIVNILGGEYHVIVIEDIKQAWLVENLSYNPGNDISEEFIYPFSNIINEKYYLSHWNGKYWEQKALVNGDKFTTQNNNLVVEYTCVESENGEQNLVKGLVYKVENEIKKIIIDAGWY